MSIKIYHLIGTGVMCAGLFAGCLAKPATGPAPELQPQPASDTTAPVVSAFSLTTITNALQVPVSITASDDVAVTAYYLSESSGQPSLSSPGWQSSKPTSYNFSGTGQKTVYAWVRDAAGNISSSLSATTTVTAIPLSIGTSWSSSPQITLPASNDPQPDSITTNQNDTSAERMVYCDPNKGGNGGIVVGTEGNARIYTSSDKGVNWTWRKTIGSGTATATVYALAYLENNIVVAGITGSDRGGQIWRSTDCGATWALAQTIPYKTVRLLTYLGSGIVLLGTENTTSLSDGGRIWRSTNSGSTWAAVNSDQPMIPGQFGIYSMTSLGNGKVLAGTGTAGMGSNPFKAYIISSNDWGVTWNTGTAQPIISGVGTDTTSMFLTLANLGNGIVLAGAASGGQGGRIYKSTDSGATWTRKGVVVSGETILNGLTPVGDGIVFVGTNPHAHAARSLDYGETWTDLGVLASGDMTIYTFAVTSDYNVVAGSYRSGGIGRIWRSVP